MAQNTDGYRKQINNVNDLPGFDKMYLFAGAPTREFDKTFRYFLSCLGNITQDGSSLLDTYHQTDPGAGPGTPGGVGNPAQQVQHAALRAYYMCICSCALYYVDVLHVYALDCSNLLPKLLESCTMKCMYILFCLN